MSLFLIIFSSILIIFLINQYFIKKKILSNYNGQKHQKFTAQRQVPLTGGIFLSVFSIILFFNYDKLFCFFFVSVFLIGLASDAKYLSSPKVRLLLQCLSLSTFSYFVELNIGPTRIYFLDLFLENFVFSIIFSTFCLLVVMNGTNFIDGLNGLVLTYYLMILLIILKFGFHNNIFYYGESIKLLIFFIFILLIFNLADKFYLGDSGAYLISFIVSILLINIYQSNQSISPFFIILLLWYPCFENLFSIVRKFKIKRSPIIADNKHLHQLLFNFLQKKFKLKKIYSNNITSFMILSYNFIIFNLSILNIYNTQFQISLILLNVIIYTFIYLRLFNYFYNFNSK